ncbi:hypothetical protein, partial [Phocaeicola sartorii]|uniref:hypothetical protein n=1 Tax=Phocaeicola sartorii TaxID=671267 RepID=UPI0025580761
NGLLKKEQELFRKDHGLSQKRLDLFYHWRNPLISRDSTNYSCTLFAREKPAKRPTLYQTGTACVKKDIWLTTNMLYGNMLQNAVRAWEISEGISESNIFYHHHISRL